MHHTRSAWHQGHEVVEVRFDPKVISYDKLLKTAMAQKCATHVFTTTDAQLDIARKSHGDKAQPLGSKARSASADNQLYYLRQKRNQLLAALPLTPIQARRVNGALYLGKDPKAYLSPRQIALHGALKAKVKADPAAAKALGKLKRPEDIDALADYSVRLNALLR